MGLIDNIKGSLFGTGEKVALRQQLLDNIALSNRFEVLLTKPTQATFQFTPLDNFSIKSIDIPETTIETEVRNYSGVPINIATLKEYDTLSITFYERSKTELRQKFIEWSNLIYDRATGRVGYYSDYIAPYFSVRMLDFKSPKGYIEWRFYNVFPNSISNLTYARGESELVEFSVAFTFNNLGKSEVKDLPPSESMMSKIKSMAGDASQMVSGAGTMLTSGLSKITK